MMTTGVDGELVMLLRMYVMASLTSETCREELV